MHPPLLFDVVKRHGFFPRQNGTTAHVVNRSVNQNALAVRFSADGIHTGRGQPHPYQRVALRNNLAVLCGGVDCAGHAVTSCHPAGYSSGVHVLLYAAFYENNDYDTKKEAEVSKAEIKGYIDTYKNDHKAFTSFLSKKVASQWNNPEFQCFWITNVRSSDIEKSPVISDILSLKGSSTFIAFLNIMQSIILFGSMLYAVNTLIEGTFAGAAVLPLTFIGGFIFHLFWEGKCQYTLPYFMLLLPLSIIGFYSMAKKLSSVTKKHLYKCGVFAVILLFIAIIFNRFIILNQDNKSYRQYREYTIEQQKL